MERINHLIKVINKINRNTQIFLDHSVKDYHLSSGSLPYLFILEQNEGISQNQISKELGNDKAMSARTISKLVELGYVNKIQDVNDSRAYQLYLTDYAKDTMPKLRQEINKIIARITCDLTLEEQKMMMHTLVKVYERTQIEKKSV